MLKKGDSLLLDDGSPETSGKKYFGEHGELYRGAWWTAQATQGYQPSDDHGLATVDDL